MFPLFICHHPSISINTMDIWYIMANTACNHPRKPVSAIRKEDVTQQSWTNLIMGVSSTRSYHNKRSFLFTFAQQQPYRCPAVNRIDCNKLGLTSKRWRKRPCRKATPDIISYGLWLTLKIVRSVRRYHSKKQTIRMHWRTLADGNLKSHLWILERLPHKPRDKK